LLLFIIFNKKIFEKDFLFFVAIIILVGSFFDKIIFDWLFHHKVQKGWFD